jgi:hypothetical protein
MATGTPESWGSGSDHLFKIILRDINPDMVAAWKDPEAFGDRERFDGLVEISCGDIFEGAPAADAIVSLKILVLTFSVSASVGFSCK